MLYFVLVLCTDIHRFCHYRAHTSKIKQKYNRTQLYFINCNKFSVISSFSFCTWCLNTRRHALLVPFYASNRLQQSKFSGVLTSTSIVTLFFSDVQLHWTELEAWKSQTGNMDRSSKYSVTECKRTPTCTHTYTYSHSKAGIGTGSSTLTDRGCVWQHDRLVRSTVVCWCRA